MKSERKQMGRTLETKRVYSLSQCKERIQLWKRRLGIADWTVHVNFVHQMTLLENSQGSVTIYAFSKTAAILLPSPETYSNDVIPNQDMEDTIVHELIHVVFDVIDATEKSNTEELMYERGIRAMAQALLDAYEGIDGGAEEPQKQLLKTVDKMDLIDKTGISLDATVSGEIYQLDNMTARQVGANFIRVTENEDREGLA